MKNLIQKKFIFEVFNSDKYICSIIASNLIEAKKLAQKKVNFNFNIVETFHAIN